MNILASIKVAASQKNKNDKENRKNILTNG